MRLRRAEQLEAYLDGEFAWRLKELSALDLLLQSVNHDAQRKALLRSAIPILYAHFEGFVKNAATKYLEFVANQQLRYGELRANFLAIAMKRQLSQAGQSGKARIHNEVADFFLTQLDQPALLAWRGTVNTRANLKSDIFKDIVELVGIEYHAEFETKEKLIDERLLKNRNEIAHGDFLVIDYPEYRTLKNDVLSILRLFKNLISNAAATGEFKGSLSRGPTQVALPSPN